MRREFEAIKEESIVGQCCWKITAVYSFSPDQTDHLDDQPFSRILEEDFVCVCVCVCGEMAQGEHTAPWHDSLSFRLINGFMSWVLEWTHTNTQNSWSYLAVTYNAADH